MHRPPFPPPYPESGASPRNRGSISALISRLLLKQPHEPEYKPLPTPQETANYVLSHCNTRRFNYIEVASIGALNALDRIFSRSELREHLRPEITRQPDVPRPEPNASLIIRSKDFGAGPIEGDLFHCTFQVFNLESGERLVQAIPYIFDRPRGDYERIATERTVRGLFHNSEAAMFDGDDDIVGLEWLSAIDVGVMNARDATTRPLRSFDPKAFGCDFLPILDRITNVQQLDPVHFSIDNGTFAELPFEVH